MVSKHLGPVWLLAVGAHGKGQNGRAPAGRPMESNKAKGVDESQECGTDKQ